jgi:hypothetical protein
VQTRVDLFTTLAIALTRCCGTCCAFASLALIQEALQSRNTMLEAELKEVSWRNAKSCIVLFIRRSVRTLPLPVRLRTLTVLGALVPRSQFDSCDRRKSRRKWNGNKSV